MRLRVLILLIIVYILLAFSWLTYSLLDYSNSDYRLNVDVLKAGLNACVLQVMEKSKNGELGNDTANTYYLKQLQLNLEPSKLQHFVDTVLEHNYEVNILPLNNDKIIQIRIRPERLEKLAADHAEQKQIWIYQASLLFLLVGAGIFGVYYSINSLYSLNKRQNNFLLSVTHEFKTPIASIRLMLQTALNPKINDDKKIELIDKSIQNTHRLEELAENMLTATQMESGKYELMKSKFDLSDLVTRIVSNYRIKGEVIADIDEGIIISGDEFILRIAFSNLLENAFKYSNDQEIEVTLKDAQKACVIQIKDQGLGIPQSQKAKVFKKFYRVQDEETRTTKGTGLGLFIVKQTILRHHGNITVSDNLPKGTIFTIRLPKSL